MLTFLSSFLAPIASITHTTLRICLNTGKCHKKKKKRQQTATPELPYCTWKLDYCQPSSHGTRLKRRTAEKQWGEGLEDPFRLVWIPAGNTLW